MLPSAEVCTCGMVLVYLRVMMGFWGLMGEGYHGDDGDVSWGRNCVVHGCDEADGRVGQLLDGCSGQPAIGLGPWQPRVQAAGAEV